MFIGFMIVICRMCQSELKQWTESLTEEFYRVSDLEIAIFASYKFSINKEFININAKYKIITVSNILQIAQERFE